MKKLTLLCAMILLSINMMAQINLNDGTWKCVLDEQFDEGASYWEWEPKSFLNKGDYSWKTYLGTIAPNGEYEVYQFGNCQINTDDNTMHLVAYYDSARIQRNNYYMPKWMWTSQGGKGYPTHDSLFYCSGALSYNKQHYVLNDNDRKFLYGYFEIRCKLPTHKGAFPAFWLQSSSTVKGKAHYEEIDIFEYSWWITSPVGPNKNTPGLGSKRTFTCGIYCNHNGVSYDDHSYARTYPVIPQHSTDLDEYHTFGCEWMPDRVVWYFDGQVVNEYYDKENIPNRPLHLLVTYAIDGYNRKGGDRWVGPGEMVIDYIKVYQPTKSKNKVKRIKVKRN